MVWGCISKCTLSFSMWRFPPHNTNIPIWSSRDLCERGGGSPKHYIRACSCIYNTSSIAFFSHSILRTSTPISHVHLILLAMGPIPPLRWLSAVASSSEVERTPHNQPSSPTYLKPASMPHNPTNALIKLHPEQFPTLNNPPWTPLHLIISLILNHTNPHSTSYLPVL